MSDEIHQGSNFLSWISSSYLQSYLIIENSHSPFLLQALHLVLFREVGYCININEKHLSSISEENSAKDFSCSSVRLPFILQFHATLLSSSIFDSPLWSLLSNSLCSWISRYLHNLQLHTKPLLHTPRFGRFLRMWFYFLERFAVIVCLCPFCSTHDAQVFWLLHLCGSCKITILSDFMSSSSASLIFPLLQAVHVSLEFRLVSLRTFRESQSGCLETNHEDKPFFFTESDLSIDLTSRGLHQGFLWGLSGLSSQYWLCSSPDFLHSWDLIWFLNNFSGKWDPISWSIF